MKNVNHSDRAHAVFSPSGLQAKVDCPGQHLLTLNIESRSGSAADRGTECHEEAETQFAAELNGEERTIPEMKESWQKGCIEKFVKHSWVLYDRLMMFGEVIVWQEAKVSLAWLVPDERDEDHVFLDCWGTADLMLYCKESKHLVVLDYKSGNAEVPPDSLQLKVYGLGAIGLLQGMGYDVNDVTLVISQPKVSDDPVEYQTTKEELMGMVDWLETELENMLEPAAPRIPGASQCQWCPASGRADLCPEQYEEMMDLLDELPEPEKVRELDWGLTRLNTVGVRLKEFKQWISHVEEALTTVLLEGKELEDFKLVEGRRPNKAWTDEKAADKFLAGQRLKEKERYSWKLLTPTQAAKVLDIDKKATVTRNRFTSLVQQGEGKPTYALKSSTKPAIQVTPVEDELVDLDDFI